MNVHPLFVHFPIGLLATYSILTLVSLFVPRIRRSSWLIAVKTFLLTIGVLAAFAAIATGTIAEDLIGENPILAFHEPFAITTTIIYLILAGAYLVHFAEGEAWAERIGSANSFFTGVWSLKKRASRFILTTWAEPVLALLGLIAITITGGLGAAIVYGPDIDPFVHFIYHLFF